MYHSVFHSLGSAPENSGRCFAVLLNQMVPQRNDNAFSCRCQNLTNKMDHMIIASEKIGANGLFDISMPALDSAAIDKVEHIRKSINESECTLKTEAHMAYCSKCYVESDDRNHQSSAPCV
jgi:hypothetical protein